MADFTYIDEVKMKEQYTPDDARYWQVDNTGVDNTGPGVMVTYAEAVGGTGVRVYTTDNTNDWITIDQIVEAQPMLQRVDLTWATWDNRFNPVDFERIRREEEELKMKQMKIPAERVMREW